LIPLKGWGIPLKGDGGGAEERERERERERGKAKLLKSQAKKRWRLNLWYKPLILFFK
jgi:hypothetical protein